MWNSFTTAAFNYLCLLYCKWHCLQPCRKKFTRAKINFGWKPKNLTVSTKKKSTRKRRTELNKASDSVPKLIENKNDDLIISQGYVLYISTIPPHHLQHIIFSPTIVDATEGAMKIFEFLTHKDAFLSGI